MLTKESCAYIKNLSARLQKVKPKRGSDRSSLVADFQIETEAFGLDFRRALATAARHRVQHLTFAGTVQYWSHSCIIFGDGVSNLTPECAPHRCAEALPNSGIVMNACPTSLRRGSCDKNAQPSPCPEMPFCFVHTIPHVRPPHVDHFDVRRMRGLECQALVQR